MIKAPKKLIEVALPLDDINAACAREKSIRHGHPSTLHLWWARRPLASARAVIFAQMVNDPGGERGYRAGLTKEQAQQKREKLFDIIRDLVKWENTTNESVLNRAREAIWDSWRDTCKMNEGQPGFNPEVLPAFHDPFAGGGALPLEAQRLGLESYASDLNPVAVTINKAMIEIPPKFAGRAPIGPIPEGEQPPLPNKAWPGATGLAEDVRRYGHWMCEEAKKRIGHLYPDVEITPEMAADRPDLKPYVGQKLTVIAWLWARTVKSPNPQFSHVDVPLISSFVLSSKTGKERYLEPVVEGEKWNLVVRAGKPPKAAELGTTAGKRKAFKCILSGFPIDYDYIRDYGKKVGLGQKLFAVVLDGPKGRVYIEPTSGMEDLAFSAKPSWKPETKLPDNPRDFKTPNYGLNTYGDLFTDRQLVALNTFSDLIEEARQKVLDDARLSGWEDDLVRLSDGGIGATAYADALAVYETFTLGKIADRGSTICTWDRSPKMEALRNTFGRQAIPMAWDFAEGNLFSKSSGNYLNCVEWIQKAIEFFPSMRRGDARQADAQSQTISSEKVISTDPPYYDNIGYADLSDFFYVWMRRGVRKVFPELFATVTVPKAEELVATPYRHGGKEAAELFFMDGMTAAMHNLVMLSHSAFPVSIYYAFKQSDTDIAGTSNAGWESFLQAVITAGFSITGTWPMRTEMSNRMIGSGTNALASSIVIVCRKRDESAIEVSRREFLKELKEVMPEALRAMQGLDGTATPVAPVDMAQAAIGPGMEIYSKYKAVLNADGTRMSVHDAIVEINRFLDKGDDFDPQTQFCRDWFQEHSWGDGASGDADVLARAKGISVAHVVNAGVIAAKGGKTRLLHWQDYPENYDPEEDDNRPVWEVCHHLVRIHQRHGTGAAGAFLAKVQDQGEAARQLAYVLYTVCERKGLADDARAYNELATGWSDIIQESITNAPRPVRQGELGI